MWRSTPQFKLDVGGTSYINDQAFQITCIRPENNVSYLVVQVNDYQSSKYVGVFDAFTVVDLSLRYGSDSWTQVFGGVVGSAAPKLTMHGEVLEVGAWGDGFCLAKTFCDESYGVESIANSTVDTPKEILEDVVDEHVNKIFGAAAATNWSIGKSVDNAHAGLSFTGLNSQYLSNFTLVNRVCSVVDAYAAGLGPAQASAHWFVDTTPNLMFKQISANHAGGNWDRYWGGMAGTSPGTQASSTITVKQDMVLYEFRKHTDEYANDVVLSSKWRRPVEDYWTEDNGGAALWGDDGNLTLSNDATHIVGSHSLKAVPDGLGAAPEFWYPSAQTMSLNVENAGSSESVPTLSFYARKNKDCGTATMAIFSSVGNEVHLWQSLQSLISEDDKWVFLEFPIGPYRDLQSTDLTQLVETGNMDWTDVDWIEFYLPDDGALAFYVDDLHFSGTVVREAKDTSEITAHKTYMKVLRNNTAVDDTLTSGTPGTTDTGMAARLAYAELLLRSQTPVVGAFRMPMAPSLLPGQTVHVHACQQASGTYRIDSDMRVKELRHVITPSGFQTEVNVTSDVMNSHAFGAPDLYKVLMEYAGALGQSEAMNLQGGALDNLVPRLSESY